MLGQVFLEELEQLVRVFLFGHIVGALEDPLLVVDEPRGCLLLGRLAGVFLLHGEELCLTCLLLLAFH